MPRPSLTYGGTQSVTRFRHQKTGSVTRPPKTPLPHYDTIQYNSRASYRAPRLFFYHPLPARALIDDIIVESTDSCQTKTLVLPLYERKERPQEKT